MASETPPVYLKYVNKRRQALLAADPQPQEATLQPATAVTLKNDPVADRFFICAEEHVAGCLAQEEHVVVEWFDQPRYWGLMPPEIRKELLTKPLMGARKLLAAAAENDLLMIAIKRCVVDQSSYADMLPAWTATVKLLSKPELRPVEVLPWEETPPSLKDDPAASKFFKIPPDDLAWELAEEPLPWASWLSRPQYSMMYAKGFGTLIVPSKHCRRARAGFLLEQAQRDEETMLFVKKLFCDDYPLLPALEDIQDFDLPAEVKDDVPTCRVQASKDLRIKQAYRAGLRTSVLEEVKGALDFYRADFFEQPYVRPLLRKALGRPGAWSALDSVLMVAEECAELRNAILHYVKTGPSNAHAGDDNPARRQLQDLLTPAGKAVQTVVLEAEQPDVVPFAESSQGGQTAHAVGAVVEDGKTANAAVEGPVQGDDIHGGPTEGDNFGDDLTNK